jgi:hypothetical protein
MQNRLPIHGGHRHRRDPLVHVSQPNPL